MENPTGESVSIGNFTFDLNENGSVSVYANKGAILVKPSTGSSIILYMASTGKSPQVIDATIVRAEKD